MNPDHSVTSSLSDEESREVVLEDETVQEEPPKSIEEGVAPTKPRMALHVLCRHIGAGEYGDSDEEIRAKLEGEGYPVDRVMDLVGRGVGQPSNG